MIHGIYKIVLKILSNKLWYVIQDLISDNQTSLILEWQIIDGFLIYS